MLIDFLLVCVYSLMEIFKITLTYLGNLGQSLATSVLYFFNFFPRNYDSKYSSYSYLIRFSLNSESVLNHIIHLRTYSFNDNKICRLDSHEFLLSLFRFLQINFPLNFQFSLKYMEYKFTKLVLFTNIC